MTLSPFVWSAPAAHQHAEAKGGVEGSAARLGRAPAELTRVTAVLAARHEPRLIDRVVLGSERTDVERVRRAVELAHEARLASVGASDQRRPLALRLEHVRRAYLDAQVAVDAALLADELDH